MKCLANAELLVTQVVEFQNDWVGLSTVCARIGLEESDQELRAFERQAVPVTPRLLDVLRAICEVVRAAVGGLAVTAVVLPSLATATLRELGEGFSTPHRPPRRIGSLSQVSRTYVRIRDARHTDTLGNAPVWCSGLHVSLPS